MASYRATRDFHLGATRMTVAKDEFVEVTGGKVSLKGNTYNVPGIEGIIDAGLLTPFGTAPLGTALTTVPRVSRPSPPPERVVAPPKAHDNPDKPHRWEAALFGNGESTCKVCGVTQSGGPAMGNIQADRPSLKYKYTDAYGVSIESLTELPCPVFIGHMGGAVAGTTHRVRKLKGQVESIEERLARLEDENANLRIEVGHRQQMALMLLERLVLASEAATPEVRVRLLPDHGEVMEILSIPEGVLDTPERVRVVDSEPS